MKAAAAVVLLTMAACGQDAGRPPVARIVAIPSDIPEHDDFRTDVTLDGSGSSDPIDDPDALDPLSYEWEIDGDAFELQPGSDLFDEAPVVRFRGDTPATIRLTVTDIDGDTATARLQLGLSIR